MVSGKVPWGCLLFVSAMLAEIVDGALVTIRQVFWDARIYLSG
jgi:hypothetical protein